jgi:hypothetical protein
MNMMNKVFMDELDKCVVVFIDDILVFSKTAKGHEEHLRIVLGKPMTELLKSNTPYVWSDKCEASFQKLKIRLTTTPVLTLPDASKDFVVYCDASRQGLGCVLM